MTGPEGSSSAGQLPPGTQVVTDEHLAALITDRRELRRLLPFMRGECSVKQAADELGLGLTATFKLAQRFMRLGLLRETRREQRAGRDIRYYRAPGAFFVPFSVRAFELMGERNRATELRRFEGNLSRAIRENLSGGWGVLTGITPSGEGFYQFVSERGEVLDFQTESAPLIVSGWNRVPLTREEARHVQRQLMELVLPYLEREPVGELYQVGIFLARESGE